MGRKAQTWWEQEEARRQQEAAEDIARRAAELESYNKEAIETATEYLKKIGLDHLFTPKEGVMICDEIALGAKSYNDGRTLIWINAADPEIAEERAPQKMIDPSKETVLSTMYDVRDSVISHKDWLERQKEQAADVPHKTDLELIADAAKMEIRALANMSEDTLNGNGYLLRSIALGIHSLAFITALKEEN